MKLHILGCSGPFPASGGACSGYLLETGDGLLQFDFGSGVLGRLTSLISPVSLDALFLSHWHFDHTSDLLPLIYRLEAEKKVLRVFAPVDDNSVIRKTLLSSQSFDITDIAPGDMITVGSSSVTVGEARHPVPSVAFRVEREGKIFVYTGDTNTLPSLASFCSGCGLLLADGLFPSSVWSEAKPHLSAELAAVLARDAGAGKLVITHLNHFFSPELLLKEALPVFSETVLASPGKVFDL